MSKSVCCTAAWLRTVVLCVIITVLAMLPRRTCRLLYYDFTRLIIGLVPFFLGFEE